MTLKSCKSMPLMGVDLESLSELIEIDPTTVSDRSHDSKWALIQYRVPEATPGGCPETFRKREILNGIFYLLRSGCS
jgi:hypothetical protein